MFSVINTGINFFPLCTAIVSPTNSGIIMLPRDHVFTTSLFPLVLRRLTFYKSESATKGPFLVDLAMFILQGYLRLLRIKGFLRLRDLVPLAPLPHGLRG